MSAPLVIIGASAGGLEAIVDLLAALLPSTTMAYAIVQHLDPDHPSLLVDVLKSKTKIPVLQIRDGLAVESGHVYVIPPGATVTLKNTNFRVTARPSGRHMPVDALQSSAAFELADRAIGVVLSGGDSDGALGIRAIKDAGGITFAQAPSTARFPSMPQSAIDTGCVDFVLRPNEIALELARLERHPYLQANTALPEQTDSAAHDATEVLLRQVFRLVRSAHGVDFTHYKRSTLQRRLARRMTVRRTHDLAAYVELIEGDPTEKAALFQDFLIRVTGFFRDRELFEGLMSRVFPILTESRSAKDPIRIWVPGCASGEEVYSIAMSLVEMLGDRAAPAGIQIFGTDVSEASVEKARLGLYVGNIVNEVSKERIERFFVKHDDHFIIAKSIRDLCIFARQDVTRDPPFSRLDLVSCRNLLIYLDNAAQSRVMQMFHYALRPNRFLILGPAESIGSNADLFELTDKNARIYTRRTTSSTPAIEAMLSARGRTAQAHDSSSLNEIDSPTREADRLLLARYAPACIVIDDQLNILQFRGSTSRFLEHASGASSLNLRRVARPELMVELETAIGESRETGAAVKREALTVGQFPHLTIEVVPLAASPGELNYLIVLNISPESPDTRAEGALRAMPETEKDRHLVRLEREVASMRFYLQATTEKHEAVREELKSAHEELLSANEEFQSTNEELETAKEELQSANEELSTTNDELRNRNGQLSVLNGEIQKARGVSERALAYADTIVKTVRDPLVVLDDELTIQRANPAFSRLFPHASGDPIGRVLIDHGVEPATVVRLQDQLVRVFVHHATIEGFDLDVPLSQSMRTLRLNARELPGVDKPSALALLAMVDVTEARAATTALHDDIQHKDEFLATLAHELRNPLAPITNAVALLRGGAGDSAEHLYAMIERQSIRLTRLVDELLDVARISRGLMHLKLETVDLARIAAHAAEASASHIEEAQHSLAVELGSVPIWVSGDSVRLEQVISNLLDNATKYTDPGGRIGLKLAQVDGDAVLSVYDNGVGLRAADLGSVFELFKQVDSSLARSVGGLGIGLTLVRKIMELHGGDIRASSRGLGHGSEFTIHLPVVAALSPIVSNAAQNNPVTKANARLRILLVDDNLDSLDSLRLLIGSWGHEVETAHDGVTALTVADRFRPDVAIVDIGLPGMNGLELGERLAHSATNSLTLVALTGYGRDEDRRATFAAGFTHHLTKPARLDELRSLLAATRH